MTSQPNPHAIHQLADHGVPNELIDRWVGQATHLTDIQQRAIDAGLLVGTNNLLVSAPTSSGKTFIGEIVASTAALRDRGRAVFAVPFKALAEEHFAGMSDRYRGILNVIISDGDRTEFDDDLRRGDFNLAVLTYEKLASLSAQHPDILSRANTLVVDEIQMIGDLARGPGLERFLTRVLLMESSPRLIALSASLDDVTSLRQWLRADAIVSTVRPVPLIETVADLQGSAFRVEDGRQVTVRQFRAAADRGALAVEVAASLHRDNLQTLVFRTTVAPTIATAEAIARAMPATGIGRHTAERIVALDTSENLVALSRTLASGVGFHNADLTLEERQLVESAFREGEARVLVSTTTLAMGVNLPSDWVVVVDTTRFAGGRARDVSVAEYKNAAGRAGRLGQRAAGHSIVLADDAVQARQIMNALVLAEPEPVESQIPRRPFADLVFGILCEGLANDAAGVVEFITSTYAYQTFYEPRGDGLAVISAAVDEGVAACVAAGLFVVEGDEIRPTAWAKQFSMAGLGADTAVHLANSLGELSQGAWTPSDALFAAASCRESGDRPWVPKRYGQLVDPRTLGLNFREHNKAGRLARLLTKSVLSEGEMGALVRLSCLIDWVAGLPASQIDRNYRGAAPVRVQSLGRTAGWLIETMARTAEVGGATRESLRPLRDLVACCRFGVPPEVTSLAALRAPGITRDLLVRLALNDKGVTIFQPDEVVNAELQDFQGLLTAAQLASLQTAIERSTAEAISRRQAGQVTRALAIALPERLISDLYTTNGRAFEQAVFDALRHLGLPATRIIRQPHGEEDIRLEHPSGTVVISVTASVSDGKLVPWAKAREVLGTGAGFNPVNYVCIGRPRFDALAVERANQIGAETGPRMLLILSVAAFAELFLQAVEGRRGIPDIADFLAQASGSFDVDGLPAVDLESGEDAT